MKIVQVSHLRGGRSAGSSRRGRKAGRSSASSTAAAARLISDTAVLSPRSSRADGICGRGINPNSRPQHQTVRDIVAEVDVFGERIDVTRLLSQDGIVSVLGQVLGVAGVWFVQFDRGDEILVEEELSDMRHGIAGVRAVGEDGPVLVGNNVDVGGATSVVAGEGGEELRDTLVVSGLNATEEGGVLQIARLLVQYFDEVRRCLQCLIQRWSLHYHWRLFQSKHQSSWLDGLLSLEIMKRRKD
jgi:hypothetical protein